MAVVIVVFVSLENTAISAWTRPEMAESNTQTKTPQNFNNTILWLG
jgi:hypothetical protein